MENQVVPRPLVWILGVVLIAFIGLYAIGKAMDISEKAKDKTPPKNTISISAEGKVTATPDLANVNVTVTSQGSSASDVENQNTTKINKIIDLVKQQGVDKKDITTSGPNIQPRYDYQTGKGTLVGYDVSQTVSIKVHNIAESTDKVSKIISLATDNGANQLGGTSFSFEDPDNFREQAREQAIAKAKDKATSLAKSAGLTLGKVVSVSENSAGYPQPMYDSMANQKALSAPADARGIAPTIEQGTQEITAQMTVVFEVK